MDEKAQEAKIVDVLELPYERQKRKMREWWRAHREYDKSEKRKEYKRKLNLRLRIERKKNFKKPLT